MGYDGERVWALPRALRAIQYGTNILNPLHAWPSKASYEFRLVKYALRGYAISIPGLESVHIDLTKIIGAPLSKLRGFARLVRLSMAIEDSHVGGGSNSDRWAFACGEFIPPVSFEKYSMPSLGITRISFAHSKLYPKAVNSELTETLKEALGELEFLRLVASSWAYLQDTEESALRNSLTTETLKSNGIAAGNGWSEEAWEAIVTHNQPPEVNIHPPAPAPPPHQATNIPVKLEDAWDSAKRSREYLNAKDTDLDARYFAHAQSQPPQEKRKSWKSCMHTHF